MKCDCEPAAPEAICRTRTGRDVPAAVAERAACCAACPHSLDDDRPGARWICRPAGTWTDELLTIDGCPIGRFPNRAGRCVRDGVEFSGVPGGERIRLVAAGLITSGKRYPGCGCSVERRRAVGRFVLGLVGRRL